MSRRPHRDVADGLVLLARGLRMWLTSPRLMLLGLLPALIAFVILAGAFVTLCVFLGPLDHALTPYADGWADAARTAMEVVVAIALLGAALLVAILVYAGLTLAIGDPFYERIAIRVEEPYGGVPDAAELPWWRGLRDGLRMAMWSLVTGVLLFGAGFLPVVGQTVVPVIGVLVGGWALALELTSVAFERRGASLRDRRTALRRHRLTALSFGTATFLLFMIPLGAVLVMPGAVAGATLLARRTLGLPVTR